MKKQTFFSIALLFTMFFLTSCDKKTKSSSVARTNISVVSSSSETKDTDSSYLDVVKIKRGTKLVINSPEVFVQLYILFNHDQKIWLQEVARKTNLVNEPEKYLEAKRNEFYQSFGLKESDFNRYSSQHYDIINKFLEEHPDYKNAVELSEK